MITFHDEMRGYHHGQSDMTLRIEDNGEYCGRIDYSVYEKSPAVQFISVPENKARRGYATKLVLKLQSMYPDTEIDMGGLTDEGSKLLNSIPQRTIPNLEYAKTKNRYDELKALEARYEELANKFAGDSEKLHPLYDKWNDLNQEIWETEEALSRLVPSKRLFGS